MAPAPAAAPAHARARERERPAPRFIEQELRATLRCGVLAHGFLRLHCDACGHERLVPFSCKRRGFCPSCGGRRMADTAAHLVDCVLPEVPVRQWVLTLPYALRYRCAYDRALTSQVLSAFLRALFAGLRRRAKQRWNAPRGQCGAVTFVQRFGSALDLNLHFHSLVLDGVYERYDVEAPHFLPLPPPGANEIARVLAGTARRIARLLETRADGDDDAHARDEPLLALLAAASLRRRTATGPNAGQRWRRLGDRVEPGAADADPDASPRVPKHAGMSLHADVAVPAHDRLRLERLCRYVARPPLARDRLEQRPDGRLALRLKTRWRDGTTHVLMERHELLERLVPLIPPPRAHQVRYHGVLAPCASDRKRIVPGPRRAQQPLGPDANGPGGAASREHADVRPGSTRRGADDLEPVAPAPAVPHGGAAPPSRTRAASPADGDHLEPRDALGIPADTAGPRRLAWSDLLQRVFGVDALRCPRCGASLRLVATIRDPDVARRILACRDLPARAPPPRSAVDATPPHGHALDPEPDETSWGFDQTSPYDEPTA